jgi:HD-GYP domain-containing protein (c-di-GMP phosphodiesterase class II)
MVAALSLATDLGMGQPMEFALRACVLAVRLGDALALSTQELADIYYVALLRSAGCTADASITAAVFGDEITARTWLATMDFGRPAEMVAGLVRHVGAGEAPLRRARRLATAFATVPQLPEIEASHCEVAQQLAGRLGLRPEVQWALGQVFERWDGRGLPRRTKGEAIAQAARVVATAQDAALFFRLGGAEAAVSVVRRRAGGAYDPRIAERFCREATGLLAGLDREPAWDMALAAEPGPWARLSEAELDGAARAIADFADLASPSTVGHSSGVAALAAAAARRFGLPPGEETAVRRAGLLHDVGRTGISAGIWNKAGPLADGEWERVRLHPYYTQRVLARVDGLQPVAALAAMHHERLDGSGYHLGVAAAMQPAGAKILAAADAYHALTEPRPHRPARPPDAAAAVLRDQARAGRLAADAVDAVLAAAGHKVRSARRAWPAGLSDREVDVIRLVARGHSNREVAEALSVSPATVDHHLRHLYNKLGVSTRAAATLLAMQHDLLPV